MSERRGRYTVQTETGVDALLTQLRVIGAPAPEREYRFHPVRKWRFDLAWPALMIAVEVEGSVYAGGRHTRGKGYEGDLRKYNAAAALGWVVYRFSTGQVLSGEAIRFLEQVLEG